MLFCQSPLWRTTLFTTHARSQHMLGRTARSAVASSLLQPWSEEDLSRLVAEARRPKGRRFVKADTCDYLPPYKSSLRYGVQRLANGARYRDYAKQRLSDVEYDHILDLILEQRGLCAYSGVPMEMLKPHSHWRMSIERIDTSTGYVKGNYCLIAAEFNSAVTKGSVDSGGSAQWSRQKVQQLTHVRASKLQLQHLRQSITAASERPEQGGRQKAFVFRGPDEQGQWWCTGCCTWKPPESFHLHSPRKEQSKRKSRCKLCIKDVESAYLQTLRGHAHQLLGTARNRAAKASWSGKFELSLQHLLDMLWHQRGRCFYSGVPLHCAKGPADWVWTLERLCNDVSYTKQNSVLIAREFNTSDHSRNIGVRSQVVGTAQWSRHKASLVWGKFFLTHRWRRAGSGQKSVRSMSAGGFSTASIK